jgi:hypothetical protein
VIRWGAQIEIRELDTLGFTKDAALCVGHIAKYVTKVDRWSAGVILGEAIAGPPRSRGRSRPYRVRTNSP